MKAKTNSPGEGDTATEPFQMFEQGCVTKAEQKRNLKKMKYEEPIDIDEIIAGARGNNRLKNDQDQ